MSNKYPRSMYKGSYTAHVINADHQIVTTEAEESALLEDGYLNGHDFFSRPAENPEKSVEPETPTSPVPEKRNGRKPKSVDGSTE